MFLARVPVLALAVFSEDVRSSTADLVVRVDPVQAWVVGRAVQGDREVQAHGVRCIPRARLRVDPVVQASVRAWEHVQDLEHAQDLGSAPVWVAHPGCRLQAKRRVRRVQVRVAVDGRVTRRPKKVR